MSSAFGLLVRLYVVLHFLASVTHLTLAYTGYAPGAYQLTTDPVVADEIAKADFLRRRDCPVPCGYSAQLCCDSNEICYTDPSNEAQCSATALPSSPTTRTVVSVKTTAVTAETTAVETSIKTSVQVQTSAVTTVLTATSTMVHQTIRIFPTTDTSVQTSLKVVNETSVATATLTVVRNATHTLPTSVQPTVQTSVQTASSTSGGPPPDGGGIASLPDAREVQREANKRRRNEIIGGVVGGVVACVLACLLFWCFRKRRNRRRDLQETENFSQTEHGPQNTAQIQESSSFRVLQPATPTYDFQPRAPRQRSNDDMGYGVAVGQPGDVWSPDAAGLPSYPYQTNGNFSSRSSTPRYDGHGTAGPAPRRVPSTIQRRPVTHMPPTAEDY